MYLSIGHEICYNISEMKVDGVYEWWLWLMLWNITNIMHTFGVS